MTPLLKGLRSGLGLRDHRQPVLEAGRRVLLELEYCAELSVYAYGELGHTVPGLGQGVDTLLEVEGLGEARDDSVLGLLNRAQTSPSSS